MGFHGVGLGSLILTLVIIALLFGTKRLRTIGEDIGVAIKGLRRGMQGEQDSSVASQNKNHPQD